MEKRFGYLSEEFITKYPFGRFLRHPNGTVCLCHGQHSHKDLLEYSGWSADDIRNGGDSGFYLNNPRIRTVIVKGFSEEVPGSGNFLTRRGVRRKTGKDFEYTLPDDYTIIDTLEE